MSDGVTERVRAFLDREAADGLVTVLGSTERAWDVMVPSYWKESIALSLEVRDRTLRAEAFFMRGPDEDEGPAYQLLLQRNQTSRAWRFSASEAGDVWLVADVPLEAVDDEGLDRLLGEVVTITDETYRPYFRVAFRTALDDQVRRGGPGIDQAPPWARAADAPPNGR
ncbi:MAG TPA: YbjN domain-containing protein [Actinomycetota bacterium]|jgi:hypothetical protein